jgi:hypothetical protein
MIYTDTVNVVMNASAFESDREGSVIVPYHAVKDNVEKCRLLGCDDMLLL